MELLQPLCRWSMSGDVISEKQIRRRIEIIKPYTSWVRSFSCTDGNEHIPVVAHANGIKTMVSAWIGEDERLNEQEIEGLIALAKDGFVDIAAVATKSYIEVIFPKKN